jgi:ABC-type amino acid transport substrate-binding protein
MVSAHPGVPWSVLRLRLLSARCPVVAGVVLLTMGAVGAPPANAAEVAQTGSRSLRVATGLIAPFVLKEGDQLTGFSVDLWYALARQLDLTSSFVEFKSSSEQVQAVERGEVDVAISAITMTVKREELVDFSHPYFESGLQVMVLTEGDDSARATMEAILSPGLWRFLAAAVVIVFLLANVLWLVERKTNRHFQGGYVRGVLEGLWGVVLIVATGEHGDRDTPRWLKRLTVGSMWLLGVVLVAQFTAIVTSSMTVQQLRSSIRGPDDLPGKTIATKPGTTAADYLTQRGLSYVGVSSGDQGCDMLMHGQVEAIVFDAPTLQYWAARRGKGVLQVVGPIFRPEKLGIAMKQGSSLRKQIDEALLTLYENGTYEEVYDKWFAQGR